MREHVGTRGSDHYSPRGRVLRRYRPFLLALLIGLAACAGALLPLGVGGANTVALACGIGATPTMAANGALALLQPVTKNVSGNLPIGLFAPDYLVGQPVTFKEDLSNVVGAPPPGSYQLLWTFGDGTQGSGLSPEHAYTKPGTYDVYTYLNSINPSNFFDSATIQVVSSLPSKPPIVKVVTSGTVIGPGGVISFDASGSHSQDGSKLTYLWNFNDGHTASGPVVKYAFAQFDPAGKWFVGLTVTDGRGARTYTAIHIQIVSQLPTAAISTSLSTIGTNAPVTFDASGSTAPSVPAGDQIVSYRWNFGDGTPTVTTTSPTVTHKFTRAGTFTVTVEAIDQQGAPGQKSRAITVVAVTGNSGFPSWIMYGGIGLLLVVLFGGGYLLVAAQRRRAALIREQEAAMQLARAHRGRPGPPSQGPYPPRTGSGQPRGPYPETPRDRLWSAAGE